MSTTPATEPAFAAFVMSPYGDFFDTSQTREEAIDLSHRIALQELVEMSPDHGDHPGMNTEEIQQALDKNDRTDLGTLIRHCDSNGVFADLQITYGTMERA